MPISQAEKRRCALGSGRYRSRFRNKRLLCQRKTESGLTCKLNQCRVFQPFFSGHGL
jgi:hypothetical protein